MTHILLVEDDSGIVNNLTEFLRQEGFRVTAASGQKRALELLEQEAHRFGLLLLDISLSDGNGFAVCGATKAITDLPVIFLTASGDEFSVITGLDLGADDYIAKPFRPRELISRINSVMRRYGRLNRFMEYRDLRAEPARGQVTKNGQELSLSALEYRLLLLFLSNKGTVLTRSRLLDELWDLAGEFVNDNTLTVYIKRLREKLEDDPQNPVYIKTIRGLGYRLGE